jgi:hypothetical protein
VHGRDAIPVALKEPLEQDEDLLVVVDEEDVGMTVRSGYVGALRTRNENQTDTRRLFR